MHLVCTLRRRFVLVMLGRIKTTAQKDVFSRVYIIAAVLAHVQMQSLFHAVTSPSEFGIV